MCAIRPGYALYITWDGKPTYKLKLTTFPDEFYTENVKSVMHDDGESVYGDMIW